MDAADTYVVEFDDPNDETHCPHKCAMSSTDQPELCHCAFLPTSPPIPHQVRLYTRQYCTGVLISCDYSGYTQYYSVPCTPLANDVQETNYNIPHHVPVPLLDGIRLACNSPSECRKQGAPRCSRLSEVKL